MYGFNGFIALESIRTEPRLATVPTHRNADNRSGAQAWPAAIAKKLPEARKNQQRRPLLGGPSLVLRHPLTAC